MLLKGQKINDRYEIIKSIGEGGMANVYLANDTILDRMVAVKVLRGDLSDDKFVRRFEREALSVSNLSHPNIVEVYDVGVEDGNHYIVMEYIEGKTLKQLLKKRETLTLSEVIDIMTQLTDGIAHAHESYIIHRDIKPQNIMIEDDGRIKITDFGIAMALNATQLTQTNSVMGSVHYLPPEQASGKSATVKSDIYSLGILMYELLTGNVPFKGDNAVEIALKHMKDKLPSVRKQDPSIPQSVENIILKAAAKNPRNRYDSAKEMHEDLLHCLDEEHANDKKIVYEYPENDIDDDTPIAKPQSKKKEEKQIKQVNLEETSDLVKEIKPEDVESDDDFYDDEPKKRNNLIIILAVTFLLLLIAGGIIWLVSTRKVQDIRVPNLVDTSVEEAKTKLTNLGFKYKIENQNSNKIEEGHIIKTSPKSGSVRKKGDEVILYVSDGGIYNYLDNYIGKKASDVKEALEAYKVNVLIEKKDIDKKDKDKYKDKDKQDTIIDQNPKYDEKAEKVLLEEGDTITLYIPNIFEEYPDMVEEGWSLADAIEFAKKYKLTMTVIDKTDTTIPSDKYSAYNSAAITELIGRTVGDPIIEGISFKVKINATYQEPTTTKAEETTE